MVLVMMMMMMMMMVVVIYTVIRNVHLVSVLVIHGSGCGTQRHEPAQHGQAGGATSPTWAGSTQSAIKVAG